MGQPNLGKESGGHGATMQKEHHRWNRLGHAELVCVTSSVAGTQQLGQREPQLPLQGRESSPMLRVREPQAGEQLAGTEAG